MGEDYSRFVVIVLARGGSKGIPKKNIRDFLGKPLLLWTTELFQSLGFPHVYVSTDNEEIAEIAKKSGVSVIQRPPSISGDTATSESGWAHALRELQTQGLLFDWVIAPQVTSPLRHRRDIESAVAMAESGEFDSLFSASLVSDLCLWENGAKGLESLSYNWRDRKRRQDSPPKYLENGSFYLFRPNLLLKELNRFGGRIGVVTMENWKSQEIDEPGDFELCEFLCRTRVLDQSS